MRSELLERIEKTATPLVEGERVTFVWRGRSAPALIGDFNDWDSQPIEMEKVGRGLWAYTARFPLDAYLEYAYLDKKSGERVEDPFNPRSVSNGVGARNHYFSMPAATHTTLARRRKGGSRGEVSRRQVATEGLAQGRARGVYLYQPSVKVRCPLLVVLDGQDYLRRGRLVTVVDNLIEMGRIRPVAMALVARSREARMVEYACSDSTLIFLTEIILPLARRELDVIDPGLAPGSCGILGASMGGLMALYAGLRSPQIFGKVLSQSGAFSVDGHEFAVMDLVRYLPPAPIKVWLDVGQFESLLDANREMKDLLLERNYPVVYREYPAGHNYTAWRDEVWRGLESCFPVEEKDEG